MWGVPSAVKDNAEICRVGMRFAVSGMEAIMKDMRQGPYLMKSVTNGLCHLRAAGYSHTY